MIETLWTALLTCRDCGQELNRAESVPQNSKAAVNVTSAHVAGQCPNGCRSTFSDFNINTEIEWILET